MSLAATSVAARAAPGSTRPAGRRASAVASRRGRRCDALAVRSPPESDAPTGQRSFAMVSYGQPFRGPQGVKTVTCDGLVPGADLQLTHWNGNETPQQYYADTSTEIALNFVASPEAEEWKEATVLNNHFDTDGLLSVWTLLDPDEARRRASLLIQAAEAGDFDEWSSEEGVLFDAAVLAIRSKCSSDGEAYAETLPQMPGLLDNIQDRSDLWGAAKEAIDAASEALAADRIVCEQRGSVGVVHHAEGVDRVPGVVLSTLFSDTAGIRRYLLVLQEADGLWSYSYQRPGHSWAPTCVRPRIPAPDVDRMLAALGGDWQKASGLAGIAATKTPIATDPEETLARLLENDPKA